MGSLVTGLGYTGARLVERLLDAGESVVGLDNLFSTDRAAIEALAANPRFSFVEGDVRDETAVRSAFQSGPPVQTVYHLAAQASASPAAAPSRYTEETNLIGPRVVLEQACEAGVSSFVFGSSVQVYGRGASGVLAESRGYGPVLDLSHLSKVYVEKLMEMFAHNRGLRCVAVRLGLVYGLSPVLKTDPRFMTAPNKFCLQAVRGESLRVDASGAAPTGLIHADDAARGMMALAAWARPGFTPVNLVGETASISSIARMVCDLAAARGIEVELSEASPGAAPPGCSFPSAASEIGFSAETSLETGLSQLLDHFLGTHQ